eukprot:COSAG06_NODE_1414_length_9536_cov_28.536717_3_plen_706_part_00
MSFVEACQKEQWFFEELCGNTEFSDIQHLCGIDSFRRKLVGMYERFVAAQIKLAAPRVFAKVVSYGSHMSETWAWEAEQECYEDKHRMAKEVKKLINDTVTIGKETSKPTSRIEILLREDVAECIEECKDHVHRDQTHALENTKRSLVKLMANVGENLLEQVHTASHQTRFRRFLTMGTHIVQVIAFIVRQFLQKAEARFDKTIEEEEKRFQDLESWRRPVEGMVGSLISCGTSELSQLATVIDNLPELPVQYMVMDPPSFLEHAKPQVKKIQPDQTNPHGAFGFVCDSSGLVSATDGSIPRGSTVIQIDDGPFDLSSLLELSTKARPVHFAYSVTGCSVISNDADVTTPWLHYPEHVSLEFLEERERFLCHRRAAELLALVFHAETTRSNGNAIPARVEFEEMVCDESRDEQGDLVRVSRQLVHLDHGDDPDWYQRNYHGERPSLPVVPTELIIPQPGTCCTYGCSRTHDTAFNPCGHTVCCWECAQRLDACPVCGIDVGLATQITQIRTGIRKSKDLCYDHPSSEDDHTNCVRRAKAKDEARYTEARDEFKRQLLYFKKESEYDEGGARQALEEARRDLRQRQDRLPNQTALWPRYTDLMEEQERSAEALRQLFDAKELELQEVRSEMAAKLAAAEEAARTRHQRKLSAVQTQLDMEWDSALTTRSGRVKVACCGGRPEADPRTGQVRLKTHMKSTCLPKCCR